MSKYVIWMTSVIAAICLCLYIAIQIPAISLPFAIACILAYILNPLVDRLTHWGVKRTRAIVWLLVVIACIGCCMLLMVGPKILAEISQLPSKLFIFANHLQPLFEKYANMHLNNSNLVEQFGEKIGSIADASSTLVGILFGGTVHIISACVGIIMIPFFIFYLLKYFYVMINMLQNLVPLPIRPTVDRCIQEINSTLAAFVRGQLLLGAILAVLYAIGFSIVGMPLALITGIVVGFGNIVPFMGILIGLVIATLLTLLHWQGIAHLFAVYTVFLVCYILDSSIISPKIVGQSVGMSPFVVIVAILVFGNLMGFLGIIIAVPAVAVTKILLRYILNGYRQSHFYTGL